MRRALAILAVLALAFPGAVSAQVKAEKPQAHFRNHLQTPVGPSSFLGWLGFDPSKFHMQHSYTLSFTSIGGHTFSQGLYLNTMTYRFSPKLVAQLQLGMLQQPLGGMFGSTTLGNRFFVSGAQVIYQPTRNLRLRFQYGMVPYGYYGYGDYYRYHRPYAPWYRSRYEPFEDQE